MAEMKFEWDEAVYTKILASSRRLEDLLDSRALALMNAAREEYEKASRHQGKGPVFYDTSFFIHKLRDHGIPGRVVGNNDPEAVYVEFGLNAGNTGRVYKYRPFGKAMDALEAESV